MMELNKILSDGIWGTICSFINANFEKIRIELMKLTHASIKAYNKGYFSSEIKLLNRWPKPEIGWYAFVGSPWPGKVYECAAAGTWTNTNVAPVIGDEVFVQMLKYYIDNDTIYWDDAKKVIKAKGGGGGDIPEEETFTISVGINPADIGKCDVGATGDYLSIVPLADGSSYTVTAKKGGTVTINILSSNGFTVSQLNVDKVSQGTAENFTFRDINSNHTMYVWMKEELLEQDSVDFLERSDLPGVYYSSIGVCLKEIKSTYPNGLTQDVTVSCIKKATEIRSSEFNSEFGIWVSILENWNKGSFYTLTIDGKNLYTINCRWLGGLYFINVDNLIFKNINMKNYCNFSGQNVPEELAAVMVRTINSDDYSKNVVFYNCKFDGYYENTSGKKASTWYCLRLISVMNAIIDSCEFVKSASVVVFASGCSALEITRNSIQGDFYINSAGLAHPQLLSLGGSRGLLKVNDNILDGVTMREHACSLSNFSEIEIQRNVIKNGAGQFFNITNAASKFRVDSNVIYGNITAGLFGYIRRIFGSNDVDELTVVNNTVYMDGEFSFSQEFFSGGTINKLINCNNIYLNKKEKTYAVFSIYGVKEYIARNNIYASSFYNNNPIERFNNFKPVATQNNKPDEGFLDFSFECRLLANYKRLGYEEGSSALSLQEKILNVDNGVKDDYKLISSLSETYPSYLEYQPEFDKDYLLKGSSANIGAYNLSGSFFDETADTSAGYSGYNIVDNAPFDNTVTYHLPTDDTVIIRLNNKDRKAFFKSIFRPEEGNSIVRYGSFISVNLSCVYNQETGMYIRDNNYELTIEKKQV